MCWALVAVFCCRGNCGSDGADESECCLDGSSGFLFYDPVGDVGGESSALADGKDLGEAGPATGADDSGRGPGARLWTYLYAEGRASAAGEIFSGNTESWGRDVEAE